MAYTSKKLIAENIKKRLHEYRELYENTAAISREDVIRALPAGAPKPAAGKILTAEHKQFFKEKGNELRAKTLSELDEWRKEVNKAKAAPPSDECVRAIQMFERLNPKSMTREEYQREAENINNNYGDNYLAYKALKSIAAAGGAHINPHPLVVEVENFESVERAIKSYIDPYAVTEGAHEQHVPTAGGASFLGFFFDELLGVDDE